MSDYPMLISNKLHSFRNFRAKVQIMRECIKVKMCFYLFYDVLSDAY